MKKLLLICAIALVGLQMASAQAPTTPQTPAAPHSPVAAVPIDSVAQTAVTILTIEPQYATDSALKAVVTTIEELQEQMYNNYDALRRAQRNSLGSRDIIPLAIMIISLAALVIIVFAILKYRFKNRDIRYRFEMERLEKFPAPAIEPKIEPYRRNVDPSDYPTRLVKKLMFLCFGCLAFLIFIGVVGNPYGFFGWLFMFLTVACFGYATVHLYLEYMKRCDRKSE